MCYGKNMYLLILTVPALIISQVRTYTYLSKLSIPGIIIAFSCMIIIVILCSIKAINHEISETEFKLFNWNSVFGYIGVAMYTFDANVIVLNIKSEAINAQRYMSIFYHATIFSICLFMVFTSICYYTYREEAKDIFTMTLPMNAISNVVRIGVCINAMFSYPI